MPTSGKESIYCKSTSIKLDNNNNLLYKRNSNTKIATTIAEIGSNEKYTLDKSAKSLKGINYVGKIISIPKKCTVLKISIHYQKPKRIPA